MSLSRNCRYLRYHGAVTPSAWLTSYRLAGDNHLDRSEIEDGYGGKSCRVGAGQQAGQDCRHDRPLNYPLIFHESFQCGSMACSAITRLSSPGGTTRTACRCSDVASPSTTRGVSENRSLPARSNVPVANEG